MFLVSLVSSVVYPLIRSIKQITTLKFCPELNITNNVTVYSIYINDFGESLEGVYLNLITTIFKDFGKLIIMIIVNTMLVVDMRAYWKSRMNLSNGGRANTSVNTGKITGQASDIKVVKAIKKLKTQKEHKTEEKKHNVIKMVRFEFIIQQYGRVIHFVRENF